MFRLTVLTAVAASIALGQTPDELARFYHLHEGGDLLPVSLLRLTPGTAKGSRFLDMANLEQYGLIADPNCGGCEIPAIGLSKGANGMLGVNCAACHVSYLEWNGKRTVILNGAPNLFDAEAFVEGVQNSAGQLLLPGGFAQTAVNLIQAKQVHAGSLVTAVLTRIANSNVNGDTEALIRDLGKVPGLSTIKNEVFDYATDKLAAKTSFTPRGITAKQLIDKPPVDLFKFVIYVRERLRFLAILQEAKKKHHPLNFGPGRVDDFGGARDVIWPDSMVDLNGPLSYLDLWNFQFSKGKRVHWDSNMDSVMDRNIGQAIAGGGLYLPPLLTVDIVNIDQLEKVAEKLTAPQWPEGWPFDSKKLDRGKQVFAETCAGCHGQQTVKGWNEVGTDRIAATTYADQPMHDGGVFAKEGKAYIQTIKDRAFQQAGIKGQKRADMDPNGDDPWDPKHGYVARDLHGVWATAPFLHNGSVLNLWELLGPPEERTPSFRLGTRKYDAEKVGFEYVPCEADKKNDRNCIDTSLDGNRNTGHPYGQKLTPDDRWAVIEYLKTL